MYDSCPALCGTVVCCLHRKRNDRLPWIPHHDGSQNEGYRQRGGDSRGFPRLWQGRQRIHFCRWAPARHDQPRREADGRRSGRDDPRGRHWRRRPSQLRRYQQNNPILFPTNLHLIRVVRVTTGVSREIKSSSPLLFWASPCVSSPSNLRNIQKNGKSGEGEPIRAGLSLPFLSWLGTTWTALVFLRENFLISRQMEAITNGGRPIMKILSNW